MSLENPEIILDDEKTLPFSKLSFTHKVRYAKTIFLDAIPTIMSYLVSSVTGVISLFFLTAYNNDQLTAGFGLGVMFNSIIALAWIYCFNQAANVYISQAFGAKNYSACGRYFRRSLTISIPFIILVSGLLFFSNKVMMLFGAKENIADYACVYTRLSIPFMIGTCIFDSMKSFIMGQEVFHPILYIQSSTLILHFFWAKLFIEHLQLGIQGAVICRTIEDWSNCIIMYIYIRTSSRFKETWGTWDKEVFKLKELWSQFKFSVSIAGAGFLDWFYWEVLTFISGTFDAQQAVIHLGLAQTSGIEYSIVTGIATTMTVFVGVSLGERNIIKAKNYTYAGYWVLIGFSVVFVLVLFIFQDLWATWWSKDPETQQGLLKAVKLYNFGLLLYNTVNAGIIAVLKAIGKQQRVLLTLLFVLYLFGIPFLAYLGIEKDLKVYGVWLGYVILQFVVLCINIYSICQVDWNKVLQWVIQTHRGDGDGEGDDEDEKRPLKSD